MTKPHVLKSQRGVEQGERKERKWALYRNRHTPSSNTHTQTGTLSPRLLWRLKCKSPIRRGKCANHLPFSIWSTKQGEVALRKKREKKKETLLTTAQIPRAILHSLLSALSWPSSSAASFQLVWPKATGVCACFSSAAPSIPSPTLTKQIIVLNTSFSA